LQERDALTKEEEDRSRHAKIQQLMKLIDDNPDLEQAERDQLKDQAPDEDSDFNT
jgi:hypothetical protein